MATATTTAVIAFRRGDLIAGRRHDRARGDHAGRAEYSLAHRRGRKEAARRKRPPRRIPATDDDGAGAGAGSSTGSDGVLVAPPLPAARKQWLAAHADALARRPGRPCDAPGSASPSIDLVDRRGAVRVDADAKLNLASNTKLLTSIAALGTLGNGFRWRTAVFGDRPDRRRRRSRAISTCAAEAIRC